MKYRPTNNVLRYAFGALLGVLVSVVSGGMLDYILPVLALPFLAGNKEVGLKEGFNFVGTISLSVCFANALSLLCIQYPLVLILMTFMVLFAVYYSKHKLMTANVKVWMLISILLIPNIAVQSFALAQIISLNLIGQAISCIICIWICYYLFPVEEQVINTITTSPSQPSLYSKQDYKRALIRTIVIMPVIVLFYFFNLASSLLVLIFIAILSMQAGFGADFKAGKAIIIGNLSGGLLAIVIYEIYALVPIVSFFLMTVLFMGLVLGRKLFSGLPMAPLFGMAFSTFLLIIGSTTSGDETANSKVWIRVAQIMMAVVYVALSFGFIDKCRNSLNEA